MLTYRREKRDGHSLGAGARYLKLYTLLHTKKTLRLAAEAFFTLYQNGSKPSGFHRILLQ